MELDGNQQVDDGVKPERENSDSAITDHGQEAYMTLPMSGMREMVSDPSKLSLSQDMRFNDWVSFEDHFEAWKVQKWTHTYKRSCVLNKCGNRDTHKYLDVHLNCVHSGMPRLKKTKHMRTKQSYMSRGCMFHIQIKLDPVTHEYFFSKFNIEHKNHEVSKEAYMSHPKGRRLSNQEVEKYVSDYLLTMKVSKDILKEMIYVDTGKRVTSHDLQNCKIKLMKASKTLSDLEVEKYVGEYMINMKVSKEKVEKRIFSETGKRVTSKQLEDHKINLVNKRSLAVAPNCLETNSFRLIKPEEEDIYDLPTDMVISDNANPDKNMISQQKHAESS